MSLLHLVIILAAIGCLLWAFNRWFTAIDPGVKKIINFVVLAACVLIALYAFGVFDSLSSVRVPRIP